MPTHLGNPKSGTTGGTDRSAEEHYATQPVNKVQQVLITGRGKHSEKHAEIRNRTVRLSGDLPCLELFGYDKGDFFHNHDFEG